MQPSSSGLRVFAWLNLGYLVLVILWGTVVRATKSGAGCGSHWPLCNGDIVPLGAELETIIEFTHRVTSGICLPLVLGLFIIIARRYGKSHPAWWPALFTIIFTITEGLIGAAIVKWEHVADSTTPFRGITMPLHLVNTYFLLATAAATVWFLYKPRHIELWPSDKKTRNLLLTMGSLLLLLGMSGAIVALGDALFPMADFGDNFDKDSHIFVRMRIWHPILAIISLFILTGFSQVLARHKPSPLGEKLSSWFCTVVFLQLCIGFLNYFLKAPVYMQVIHLAVANGMWLIFCFMSLNLQQERYPAKAVQAT